MISPWTIYWITRLDAVGNLLGACATVLLTVAAFCIAARIVEHINRGNEGTGATIPDALYSLMKRCSAGCLAAGMLCVVGAVLTPTTKQMAAIYLIPAIANNEQIQAEASELYDLAKDYLKSQTEEE